MADRKISDLTALTTPASGDYLPIVDISEASAANKNKRITIEELLRGAPDGTAGAPGFAFESDPDSGLYSTGANGVALSTGGTGRLFVDASGNVGLGITPVANTLLGGARGSSLPGLIEFAGNGNTVGSSGFAIGQDGSGVATLFQRANAAMYFATNGSERLRITSAGLVGIGTSSPDTVLHTYGGFPTATIERNAGTSAAASLGLTNSTNSGFLVTGSDTTFTIVASTAVTSGTGLTERLRIDSSGNVGIGTTSPSYALDVSGQIRAAASSTLAQLRLERTDSGTGHSWLGAQSDALLAVLDSSFAEKMRLDSSGRLLVGTSSDSGGALLQVNGNRIRVATAKTPSSASDTGTAGEICWDADYIYVCTATNTWKRTAISTWP
jgi:hypothetical protein